MSILPDLLSLNIWARPFGPQFGGEGFEAAREQATQRRLAASPDAWNAWARAMLDLREQLNETAEYVNDVEDRRWRALAETSLEGDAVGAFEFAGRLMPSTVRLSNCRCSSHLFFTAGRFGGDVVLSRCVFVDDVDFASAEFAGRVTISRCRFEERCDFSFITADQAFTIEASIFERDAWFRSAQFGGAFEAREARFRSDVGFLHAAFHGAADFTSVLFEDTLGVEKASFWGGVSFSRTFALRRVLDRDVVFHKASAKRVFQDFIADNVTVEAARPSAKVIPFRPRDRRKGA